MYWRTKEFCNIIHNFDYLFQEGFVIKDSYPNGRANSDVKYYNHITKIIIQIIGHEFLTENDPGYSVVIMKKRSFPFIKPFDIFGIDDYYETFSDTLKNGEIYPIEIQAKFIKDHLMPVIKGEMWIDELVSKRKK